MCGDVTDLFTLDGLSAVVCPSGDVPVVRCVRPDEFVDAVKTHRHRVVWVVDTDVGNVRAIDEREEAAAALTTKGVRRYAGGQHHSELCAVGVEKAL